MAAATVGVGRDPSQSLHVSDFITKPMALSAALLDIKLEQPESHFFEPGCELKGSVTLSVLAPLEVKSMDIKVYGEATLTLNRGYAHENRRQELFQEKYHIMSKPPGEGMTDLEIKTHKADFQVELPKPLPPTVICTERSAQFVFAIRYFITASIYESFFDPALQSKVLRPIIVTCRQFFVQRPVAESELIAISRPVQFNISTKSRFKSLTAQLQLAREFYQMGEHIQGTLTFDKKSKQVKSVRFSIEQRATFTELLYKQILNSVEVKSEKHKDGINFSLAIPQTAIPSAFGYDIDLASVEYYLKLEMGDLQATMYKIYVLPCRDLSKLQLHLDD